MTPPAQPLVQRLLPALCLRSTLYAEVSADARASGQALLVVLLSGVANGLGLARQVGVAGISIGVCAGVLGWFLWTLVVYGVAMILVRRRPARSLLRALGFATVPGVFLAAGSVPVIGAAVRLVVVIWLVAATAVGVQAVYEISRRRAVVIAVAAFVVYLVIGALSAHWANT